MSIVNGLFEIADEDKMLFAKISAESTSENEKHFFRIMEYREKHNCSGGRDFLMDSMLNPDGIGFTRESYDSYLLFIDGSEKFETNTLSFFLNYDLSEYILERTGCRTMFEYLRSIDYSRIDYDGDTE